MELERFRMPKWAEIEAELFVLSIGWIFLWISLGLSRYCTVYARPGTRRERLCGVAIVFCVRNFIATCIVPIMVTH